MVKLGLAGNRARIVFSIVAGLVISTMTVGLGAFIKLAYEHNALGRIDSRYTSLTIMFLEWPNTLLIRFGFIDADFYHPHIGGSAFWWSVGEYILINTAGWSLVALIVCNIVSRIIRTRRG